MLYRHKEGPRNSEGVGIEWNTSVLDYADDVIG
jgi:hypothetical protein